MNASRFTFDGSKTPWVSVGIERTGDCTAHAGLLYRDTGGNLHFLHLAWHRILRHEAYSGAFGCAIPVLDSADELFLSGFCGRIWRAIQHDKIPFGLRHDPDVRFDLATGEVRFPVGATGLNCANMVLAVFRSSGNTLLDPSGWRTDRAEDHKVQQEQVDLLLSRTPDEQAQGRVLQSDVGRVARIRPEEAAGACLEDSYPAAFTECEANGQFIRQRMEERHAASLSPSPESGRSAPAPAK